MTTGPGGDPLMRIGELARRTGVTTATLRAWDRRHGLVPSVRTAGNQRLYPVAAVAAVLRVRDLNTAGTPLSEVRRCLEALAAVSPPVRGGPTWLAEQRETCERSVLRCRELVAQREVLVRQREDLVRRRRTT